MSDPTETAYLGLGANLGPRERNIRLACDRLRRHPAVFDFNASSLHETEPVGSEDAPAAGGPYLNGAARLRTALSPVELLKLCLQVEASLGRRRERRNAPRTIDLDLLLFGDRVLRSPAAGEEPGLELPHPRLLDRVFVLEPLCELAPDVRHPVSGRTLRSHLEELRSAAGLRGERKRADEG